MAQLRGNARGRYVRDMFGSIAPSYDLMNALMTFGMFRAWQRLAAEIASPGANERGLDIATGTGDLAIDLTDYVPQVVGLDFSRPMLLNGVHKVAAARGAISLVEGDAHTLPFPDDSFDCVTVGFGVRNFGDIEQALREMARVVRPGGRVVCLELTRPWMPGFRDVFRWYFHAIVPIIGGIVSGNYRAYKYLPRSVDTFPDAETLRQMFRSSGLVFPDYRLLNLGTIAIHWGTKPVR